MREKRLVVVLDDFDHRVVIRALNDLRTNQLSEQKPTEDVDQLLIRVIDAPQKHARKKPDHAR